MQFVNFALGLSHILSGAIMMLVAWPLLQNRIKPNRWYGVRIAKAFESEANWYAINRFGGRVLMQWSAALILFGVLCLFVPIHRDSLLIVVVSLAPLIFVFVPLILILRYAKTL